MKISRILTLSLGETGALNYLVPKSEKYSTTLDRWAICSSFVEELTGNKPHRIRMSVSDEKMDGWESIVILNMEVWNWTNPRRQRTNEIRGMYAIAAKILNRMMLKSKKQFPIILYVKAQELA